MNKAPQNTVYAAKQKIIFEQAAEITKLNKALKKRDTFLMSLIEKNAMKMPELVARCKEILGIKDKE